MRELMGSNSVRRYEPVEFVTAAQGEEARRQALRPSRRLSRPRGGDEGNKGSLTVSTGMQWRRRGQAQHERARKQTLPHIRCGTNGELFQTAQQPETDVHL